MIAPGEKVFVDTGAWIALAEEQDPLHARAVAHWEVANRAGAKLFTAIPVVIETFTFLDRRGSRELALRWKLSLEELSRFAILPLPRSVLQKAWRYFDRKELHKLSLVDATSFALMREHGIRTAFAFDTHFGAAGFRYLA